MALRLIIILLCTVSASSAFGQAVWRGRSYSGRVCIDPNCKMCNSIQQQLDQQRSQRVVSQPRIVRREVIQSVSKPEQKPALPPAQQPTPPESINHALKLLQLSHDDVLADFGCGDARVLIQAANQYGCRGVGIEIDPERAAVARKAVRKEGLESRILIITGNALLFDPDAHHVTAGYAYLYPELLAKLKPKFERLPRVASPIHAIPGMTTQKNQKGSSVVYVHRHESEMRMPGYKPSFRAKKVEETKPPAQSTQKVKVVKPVKRMQFFTAPWCGLCVQMKPVVQQLVQQGYVVDEINYDANRAFAQQMGVRALPSFVVGNQIRTGIQSPATLRAMFGASK